MINKSFFCMERTESLTEHIINAVHLCIALCNLKANMHTLYFIHNPPGGTLDHS